MFTQDHTKDFEAVLSAPDPFALVRFGDGEMALVDGVAHDSADAWSTTEKSWLRRELLNSLYADIDGFCMGLPTPCCLSRSVRLRHSAKAAHERQTFATLFMHGNLPRAYELQIRFSDAVVVNAEYGDIRIPRDGVSAPWDVNAVVDQLLEVSGRPILLAAGPCSNIIALRYWRRQDKPKRVPIVDVGSMLDILHGRITRHYHGKMNDHHCSWDGQLDGAPLVLTARAHDPEVTPGRMRIGRGEPSQDARPIQRQPQRILLGKS